MNIEFDYRFDTNGFFDDPDRRTTLEAAANIWESFIEDDFEAIPAGVEFTVRNPQTLDTEEKVTLDAEIDDLIIFVGAVDFSFKELGLGGPSGSAIGSVFSDRFNSSDFEPWIGAISFDSDPSGGWFFDGTPDTADDLPQETNDFLNVALHEIAHVLGIGTTDIFSTIGEGGSFDGVNALNPLVNGGEAIPLEPELNHIAEGFLADGQPVVMDPSNSSVRVLPTAVDLALLADIGYEIVDFNGIDFIPQGEKLPIATSDNDTIFGTTIADTIDALEGDDTIHGNLGSDTLSGGAGIDLILGEDDRDLLFGGDDRDQIQGGNGDDTLYGGAGDDFQNGSDITVGGLIGQEGNDVLFGEAGNDLLFGGYGSSEIETGNDELVGGEGNDTLLGEEGDDRLFGGENNDLIQGESGDDTLDGGSGDDTLDGGEGNDRFIFRPNDGNDRLVEFVRGEDVIAISSEFGFSSASEILARIAKVADLSNGGIQSQLSLEGNLMTIESDFALTETNLTIFTPESTNKTFLFGSLKKDTVNLNPSSDIRIIFTGANSDRIDSELTDTETSDRFYAGSDNDTLIVSGNDKRLFGGQGNDTLDASAGQGNNRLYGGEGDDRLLAGSGDFLFGGVGADEFTIASGQFPEQLNMVGDFVDGVDRIKIEGISTLGITADEIQIRREGNDAIVTAAGKDLAQIMHVEASLLTVEASSADIISIA